MQKPLIALAAAALFTVGCATKPAAPAVSADEAAAAIAAAEKSAAAANAVGYEWRDTDKLIEEAKKAAADKDYAAAAKLANKADKQGQLAVTQHADQLEAYKKMMK